MITVHSGQSHRLLTEFSIGQVKLFPLSDRQHDNRKSAAGMPATRQPQASVLADGDCGGEEVLRQPGRLAVRSSFRAKNRSFQFNDRQEEEEEEESKEGGESYHQIQD